jgi:hypothetical protein
MPARRLPPPWSAFNTDSAFVECKDVVRVVARIACSVGTSCRARAQYPCIAQML